MVNCVWCSQPIEELPLRKARLKVNFTHTEGAETEYQSVCYHPSCLESLIGKRRTNLNEKDLTL